MEACKPQDSLKVLTAQNALAFPTAYGLRGWNAEVSSRRVPGWFPKQSVLAAKNRLDFEPQYFRTLSSVTTVQVHHGLRLLETCTIQRHYWAPLGSKLHLAIHS